MQTPGPDLSAWTRTACEPTHMGGLDWVSEGTPMLDGLTPGTDPVSGRVKLRTFLIFLALGGLLLLGAAAVRSGLLS